MSSGRFLLNPFSRVSRDVKTCWIPVSRGDLWGCKMEFMKLWESVRKSGKPFSRDSIPWPPIAIWVSIWTPTNWTQYFPTKRLWGFGRVMLVPQLVVKWGALLNGKGCLVETWWSLKTLQKSVVVKQLIVQNLSIFAFELNQCTVYNLVEKFDQACTTN